MKRIRAAPRKYSRSFAKARRRASPIPLDTRRKYYNARPMPWMPGPEGCTNFMRGARSNGYGPWTPNPPIRDGARPRASRLPSTSTTFLPIGPRPHGRGRPLARTSWRAEGDALQTDGGPPQRTHGEDVPSYGQGVATVLEIFREGAAGTGGFRNNARAALGGGGRHRIPRTQRRGQTLIETNIAEGRGRSTTPRAVQAHVPYSSGQTSCNLAKQTRGRHTFGLSHNAPLNNAMTRNTPDQPRTQTATSNQK